MIFLALTLTFIGGWPFAVLAGLVAGLMLFEWNAICGGRGFAVVFWLESLAITAALAAFMLGNGRVSLVFIAAGLSLAVLLGRRFEGGFLWAPLGFLYAALPALAILWLRQLLSGGFDITIWVFAVVWATDIGGYAFGRILGGAKLAPSISPNKTWAGLMGGMVLAATISIGLGRLFGFVPPWVYLGLAAAGLAVWAQIGDLVESALKRHFDVKDSGAIIPGHGGVLDRLDGFVFVAPLVAFILWWMGTSMLVGG